MNEKETDLFKNLRPTNPNYNCQSAFNFFCYNDGKCINKIIVLNETHYELVLYCECAKVKIMKKMIK